MAPVQVSQEREMKDFESTSIAHFENDRQQQPITGQHKLLGLQQMMDLQIATHCQKAS